MFEGGRVAALTCCVLSNMFPMRSCPHSLEIVGDIQTLGSRETQITTAPLLKSIHLRREHVLCGKDTTTHHSYYPSIYGHQSPRGHRIVRAPIPSVLARSHFPAMTLSESMASCHHVHPRRRLRLLHHLRNLKTISKISLFPSWRNSEKMWAMLRLSR